MKTFLDQLRELEAHLADAVDLAERLTQPDILNDRERAWLGRIDIKVRATIERIEKHGEPTA